MAAEAAAAAEAAGSQEKFRQMHSALFVTESRLTNSALADSAAAIGLNMASFQDETSRTSCQPLNVLLAAFADEPVCHRQHQRNGRQAQ
jgi:protein-disulfide isomerase